MGKLPLRWLRIVAIATTMTFVFATAIGMSGLTAQQGTIALGASTTLTIISGEVSVRASDAEAFRPVADGALLRAGMTIQTGPDTYAVLTYFEGSTVSIDPNTALVVEALEANPDGSTVIAMRQQIGRTWHSVTKLLLQGSKYEVRTPTATATVRGTMFAVGVETDEEGEVVSTVETTEGAVATAKAPTAAEPRPQEVLVQPGFQVAVKQTAPIEQPKPAPEPDRKVTVTLGAAAGLVVDPVGRANGIKDGKVVVQTPGATVSTVDGKLVVTFPKIPDGTVAAVVDPKVAAHTPVEVVTTVSERGRSEQRTEQRAEASAPAAPAVTAVEVKKGKTLEVAKVTAEQKRDIASSVKVADAPKPPSVEERKRERKGGESKDKERKEEKRDGPGGPGGPPAPGGFVPTIDLPAPARPGGDQSGPQLIAKRTEPLKEQSSRPPREQPKQEPPKAEGPRSELPKIDLPRIEAPKAEASKSEGQKNEALKKGTSKDDRSRDNAPKAERPKTDASEQEAKDHDQDKANEKGRPAPGTSTEVGRFVPSLALPPIPLGTEASKKEPPTESRPTERKSDNEKERDKQNPDAGPRSGTKKEQPKDQGPKFVELPKVERPFFQPAPKPAKAPERTQPTKEQRTPERSKDRGDDDKDRHNDSGGRKAPEPAKRGELQRENDRSNSDRAGAAGGGAGR